MTTPENDPYPVIYAALDCLMAALDLGSTESSTEALFAILASAFSNEPFDQMNALFEASHNDGLCLDMRGPIARALVEARTEVRPLDHPFRNN